MSSDYEAPLEVRVRDPVPEGLGQANVALPQHADAGTWEQNAEAVTCRTVVPPEDTTCTSYLLYTDDAFEASPADAPTIERVQPVDSTAEDGSTAVDAGAHAQTNATAGSGSEGRRRGETPAERNKDLQESAATARFETSERAAEESDVLVPRRSETEPRVSIVMPTMNEEAGVAECIERAKRALRELGLTGEIVVSDSSGDRTPEIAAERGAHVVTPDEKGYGYAYRYAFARARGEYLVIGDADTTYDFEELPKLFDRLQQTGADMVLGSRLEGEIKSGAMPALHQYVGNPLLTKFLNDFYGAGVSDAHSGFRVIEREALERLDLRSDGMEFASEMIMQAAERGLHIEEVPIVYHEREGEATLDSFHDGWRHVRFMLLNAPGQLFTVPAIGLGLVGVVMMWLSFMNQPVAGIQFDTHTMIAGNLFLIVAYQIGSLGLFSAVAAEPIQSPSDPITELITDRFRLEHGTTIGLCLFSVSAVYITYLIIRWIESGYTVLPVVPVNMLAFTGLALGIQTVFYSFFFSLLGDATGEATTSDVT